MATDPTAYWLSLGQEFSNLKALVSDMALIYSRRYGKSHKKTRDAYRLCGIVQVDLANDLDVAAFQALPNMQGLTSVFYRTERKYHPNAMLFLDSKPYPKFLTDEQLDFADMVYEHFIFFTDYISTNPLLQNGTFNKHIEDIQAKFDLLYELRDTS